MSPAIKPTPARPGAASKPETFGNSELADLIRYCSRKKSARFVTLRYDVVVTYHATKQAARRALSSVEAGRRVGLVDRKTGQTQASKEHFQTVVETFREWGLAELASLNHKGNIRPLNSRRNR